MSSDDTQNLLRTAIQTAQSGNKAIARRMLEQVVDQDPRNELAWIWLASVADSPAERRRCLEKVLEINPNNDRAKQALARLGRASAPAAPAPVETTRPASRAEASAIDARARRTSELEREALLKARTRRRRGGFSPLLYTAMAILAVVMIAAGLILLWDTVQSDDETEPTATPQPLQNVVVPTSVNMFASPTPLGGELRTLPPRETLPATWTPTATWTPSVTPTFTPTPFPLDERMLLVSVRQGEENEWALYTLGADGSGRSRLNMNLPPAGVDEPELELLAVFDASFSPDGSRIAFTGRVSAPREEGGASLTTEFQELFIAPAEGGVAERLTTLESANVQDASWSSTGEQIVFASDADGDFDIYVVSLLGGLPQMLTRNDADDRDPAWSPDGEFIVFASDESTPGELEIWRMDSQGSDLKQLTENVSSSYSPAWSPDSQSIVFLSNRRVNTDLYIMTADGAGERAILVRDVDAEERDPAWSPDGEWIVFSSNRDAALYELYLIRPDGSDLNRVTTGESDTRYAAWKP
ncbi:MAG: PD40 domain-containing protein [Chloroflexi bacterium]|nr:PD40 domain-containing protein [Chloroflexota bacterium]